MKSKICIDCGEEKLLTEFHKQITVKKHKIYSRDGYRTDCKKCHYKKSTAAYKKKNNISAEKRLHEKLHENL